jgi:hypothetical protein
MTKPLDEWSVDELRGELTRLTDELVRRAAAPPATTTPKKHRIDVVLACENWVDGLAWDETFTVEMVEDEFSVLERKGGQELAPLDRERLLQLWLARRSERYPAAA